MTDGNIYKQIAERTGGEIYAGIVGPVRTGKSTFIKRFMELFVVPGIENTYVRTRAVDQLPQSGDGRTITTTEPKFIPEEAVKVKIGNVSSMMRMVDCVGYLVPGVLGHTEDGKNRMVKTPWSSEEMAFEDAAELGTRKVIADHSTIGILVTCDGSFGEIPRDNYKQAEQRTAEELKALGKPFVIILNCIAPESAPSKTLAKEMEAEYGAPVICANCMTMGREISEEIFRRLLGQFPVSEVFIDLPDFLDALPADHAIKASLVDSVFTWMESLSVIGGIEENLPLIADNEFVKGCAVKDVDMAKGSVVLRVALNEGLYFQIIEDLICRPVKSDKELFMMLKELADAKTAFDYMEEALQKVGQTGYGIVHPKMNQMELGRPEVFKQGNKYGVRLVASAPCLHMVKTDITTEISPIVGSEQQSQDLCSYLLEKFDEQETSGTSEIWSANLFGKTLQDMVSEQMEGKLTQMPQSLQGKVQRSLQRISNEGKDYFICILL